MERRGGTGRRWRSVAAGGVGRPNCEDPGNIEISNPPEPLQPRAVWGITCVIFVYFRTLSAFFELYMASQSPRSHLKTFLEPAASFSQSLGPYRPTATPIMPKLLHFGRLFPEQIPPKFRSRSNKLAPNFPYSCDFTDVLDI